MDLWRGVPRCMPTGTKSGSASTTFVLRGGPVAPYERGGFSLEFKSKAELEKWLARHGIDTTAWGCAGSKKIANLWHEYTQGEIAFREEPPIRVARVVQILLRRDDEVILELAQEFADGTLRRRESLPSEKIIAAESPLAAAERGLCEELGIDPQQIQGLKLIGEEYVRTTASPSYPGLVTEYTLFTVEARAAELPGSDFWRENKAAVGGDPVRRHLWGWRRSA